MKYILSASLMIMAFSLSAMDVGGTISQDTIWDLQNSPYRLVSFLYIASGVTLTIEPGVQVQINGASIEIDWNGFFWHGTINNPIEPIAKMIVVHGKIVAHGTQANPIVFETWQSDQLFRWGGIHFTENASKSEFEYCHINRTFMGIIDYTYPNSWGALCVRNGRIDVKYCTFEINTAAISCGNLLEDTVIYGCKFTSYNLSGFHFTSNFISAGSDLEDAPTLTIARCEFSGTATDITGGGSHREIIFNKYINFNDTDANKELSRYVGSYNMYGNESYNSQTKFFCMSYTDVDTVYCRRNYIYKPNMGSGYASLQSYGPGYNVLSDNYGYGHVQFKDVLLRSDIYNNILETTSYYGRAIYLRGNSNTGLNQPRIYNNLLRHYSPDGSSNAVAIYCWEVSPLLFNNTIINYPYVSTGSYSTTESYNNILDGNIGYDLSYIDGHPHVFMNNCVDTPIPPSFDGGGNIMANPQYADSLGSDFSLAHDSPCIDTGAYLPDLPDFDIRYHKRIASGTGGQQTIDIGAYEFDSAYIGGFRGIVFNPDNGEMIDCAKIEINQKLPEFSDSLGCFEYPTGPGVYTIRASRWDYEDQIIENIVVSEGEIVQVVIPMYLTTTDIDDPVTPSLMLTTLTNYPNPFNPETTIRFSVPSDGRVIVTIYNIKGQRVKQILNEQVVAGRHAVMWNGTDSSGRTVSSGLYFARIEQGNKHRIHKMMLMK